jgi:hypothetical protein
MGLAFGGPGYRKAKKIDDVESEDGAILLDGKGQLF